MVTSITKHFLRARNFLPAFITAVMTPALKKPTLDLDVLTNYRSISHPLFLSKIMENVIAAQFQEHL